MTTEQFVDLTIALGNTHTLEQIQAALTTVDKNGNDIVCVLVSGT
jgi:hypothetical protein